MPNGLVPAGKNMWLSVPWPSGPTNSAITQAAFFNMATVGPNSHATGHIWFIGIDDSSGERKPSYMHEEDFTLTQDVFKGWQMPDNAALVSVFFNEVTTVVGWTIEAKAK